MERIEDFKAFIVARHAIYEKRAAGAPPPWTEDPILRDFRFSNIYRELDKTTVWVRENVREQYCDHPWLWFMLALARRINWIPTLQELMEARAWPVVQWNPEAVRMVLRDRKERGEKVFSAAYMQSARQPRGTVAVDKATFTADLVMSELWRYRQMLTEGFNGGSMQWAWKLLAERFGWGGFSAYEVVTDAAYTEYGLNWMDRLTWAFAGPGAIRGLNRLYGRPLTGKLPQDWALNEMLKIKGLLNSDLVYLPEFQIRDVEHSLCEWDKYERLSNNEGRVRERYTYKGD